jgi:hypothetical protein
MAIKDRPYVGSWEMGKQTVVRHTPDARVLINGQVEFAVCATCNKKLDFNKYITSVSCDPSTDPVSTASISLSVPRHHSDVFSHDGNYVLQPGLEVVIQMRGYFPSSDYAAKGQDEEPEGSLPVYPYYQVFRGVMTEVTHEFSGGYYAASISASNLLHFWQYLYLSTNGSVFGQKPKDGHGVAVDLSGHRFTGMSPYGIIYTLMRVGFGAAFGVGWTISQTTNISAVDDETGQSLYKHAALWWEKRWQESSTRLRMYGFDGTLFNAFEQSYLGLFDAAANGNKGAEFLKSFGITLPPDFNADSGAARMKAARVANYRGTETTAAFTDGQGHSIDANKMQAYTLDLGRLGQVNFFESEYMSKLEIANAVKEISGFEFYQDVDGDMVFKPPFYNLDTSDDPVYRIADRDLISISESEREPEATYVKGSGSLFQNFTGILSGEFGTREGRFIDWRLVAQYGYKETSFESHYYSSSKQMFVGAMMRLDQANAEMRSASITIPLRPELRPGYPVYVEHLDCFYYVKSISHSYSPGASCTTTLTCVAKRAKFLPPGLPDRSDGGQTQNLPSLDNVHLDAPGEYPPMPMYAFSEDLSGSSRGSSGPPRIIGYPNVVLALDPNKINPRVIPGVGLFSDEGFLDAALAVGALRKDPSGEGKTYLLSSGNGPEFDQSISRDVLADAFDSVEIALSGGASLSDAVSTFAFGSEDGTSIDLGAVFTAVFQSALNDVEDGGDLVNYMTIQTNLKAVFGSSSNVGQFRYYSSSAPDEMDQSPSEFFFDQESNQITRTAPGAPDTLLDTGDISVLRQVGDRITVEAGFPTRGFKVYGFSPSDDPSENIGQVVTTKNIRFINFSQSQVRVKQPVTVTGISKAAQMVIEVSLLTPLIRDTLLPYAQDQDPSAKTSEVLGGDAGAYREIYNAIKTYATALGVAEDSGIKEKFEKYNDVTKAYKSYTFNAGDEVVHRDREGTVLDVTGISFPRGIQSITFRVTKTLTQFLSQIQDSYTESNAVPTTEQVQARRDFLRKFDGYTENSGSEAKITSDSYTTQPTYSTVLPVSDNGGYEVYGTMAYGRGLNIASYSVLLATQGSPTTTISMLAVETFFAQLTASGADVATALGALPVENRASLATALETTTENLATRVEDIINDDSSAVFVRNTPITSYSRGMSNTDTVNVAELADLTVDASTVCLCKGVEATFFLQAFTGEFVELAGDEAVNDFLVAEAEVAGEPWRATKQALAGQVVDTRYQGILQGAAQDLAGVVQQTGILPDATLVDLTPEEG